MGVGPGQRRVRRGLGEGSRKGKSKGGGREGEEGGGEGAQRREGKPGQKGSLRTIAHLGNSELRLREAEGSLLVSAGPGNDEASAQALL